MHIENILLAIVAHLGITLDEDGNAVEAVEERTPPKKRNVKATEAEPAAPAKKAAKGGKKAPAVSLDDIRAVCGEIAKSSSEGKEKIVATLQRHGAERLSELDPSHWAATHAMLVQVRDDDLDPRDGMENEEEGEDEDF